MIPWNLSEAPHDNGGSPWRGALFAVVLLLLPGMAGAQWMSQSIQTRRDPWGINVNPVTNKIYVALTTGHNNTYYITEIDGSTGGTQQIAVTSAGSAKYIAVNPFTNRIYVLCIAGTTSYVVVVNGATRAIEATIAISAVAPTLPCAIAVNASTNKIYVAGFGTGNVSVIDGSDNALSTIPLGDYPVALGINPNTDRVFVVKTKMISGTVDSLCVLNGSTNTRLTTVAVGSGANCAAVSPDTNLVYVSNYYSNTVTLVNADDWSTTTVAVRTSPACVAIDNVGDENGPYAWVGYDTGDKVSLILRAPGGNPPSVTHLTVGNGPHNLGVDQSRHLLYVSDQAQDAVAVGNFLDIEATVAVGDQPTQLVANPVTGFAYAVDIADSTVAVIKGEIPGVKAIPNPGGTLNAVAYDPCTKRAYVSDFTGNRIIVWDPVTQSVITTVATGAGPAAVSVNPRTGMIYTANYNGNSVTAVDPSAWTPTTIVAGTNPAAVVTNPRLNEIYVVNFGGNNVTIIDGTSYATSQVAAGTNPCAIALNPATDKVYVCNRGSNNVTIIDGATHGASTVAVGSSPRNLAVDPERNRIYVSNYSGSNVTVIEGATLATTTVATGLQPQGVAVDPVRNVAYVANSGAGNCTVINGATYATSTIPLGISSPSIVGMSGHTNEIYVLNAGNSFALIDGVAKTAKTYTTDWQANAIALSLDTNLGNAVFLAGADSKIHMYGDSFKSAAHPNPLTTSITALSGNSCTTHTPTLTGSSVNARHPDNSNIKKVFFAIDDIRGMWKEATITGGAGSTTVTWQAVLQESLTTGLHRIYAFALDATCGTIMGQSWSANTPFTGAISSYAFSVSPAPGQDRWSDSFADGDISDWTIVNGGGTVGLDPVTYFSPPFSLHVQGASGPNEFASVQSPEVSFDSTKEYQISFRFRYTDFHWDQFLIFGHIRLLLDYPYLPMRFDPVGDYSYQYVPGSAPVAAYLPPEVWGLVTVAVSPASRTYTIWINETLVGTVAYLASLIPTNRVYLEDNPGQSNFLTANYDDFSVIGLGAPGAEVGDEPSWGEDLFLWQNAPNPFGGATTIAFRIPKATKVSLELYDLQGKLVRILADGTQSAGTHPIVWDGRSNEGHRVVSGVYYYRLKTPGYEESRKLVLLR